EASRRFILVTSRTSSRRGEGLLARSRHVVLCSRAHGPNLFHQIVERFIARLGIELGGLDHEQRRRVVVEEEMMVRLVQLAQVLRIRLERVRFGISPPRATAPQQYVGGRLQVEHEIWCRDVAREELVQRLVDVQLIVVEVQKREDLVLVEQIVADGDLTEQIGLTERRLLSMAREQIKELSLQRRSGTAGIEVGDEWIVGFLEHDGRIEARAEPFGESTLPDADRAFDR